MKWDTREPLIYQTMIHLRNSITDPAMQLTGYRLSKLPDYTMVINSYLSIEFPGNTRTFTQTYAVQINVSMCGWTIIHVRDWSIHLQLSMCSAFSGEEIVPQHNFKNAAILEECLLHFARMLDNGQIVLHCPVYCQFPFIQGTMKSITLN